MLIIVKSEILSMKYTILLTISMLLSMIPIIVQLPYSVVIQNSINDSCCQ